MNLEDFSMSITAIQARIMTASADHRLTTAEVDSITKAVGRNLDQMEYAQIASYAATYESESAHGDMLVGQLVASGLSQDQAVAQITGGRVTGAQYREDLAARQKLNAWVQSNSPNTGGGTLGVVAGSTAAGAAAGAGIGVWGFGVGALPGAVVGGVVGFVGGLTSRLID
jgi:hypothetical protein